MNTTNFTQFISTRLQHVPGSKIARGAVRRAYVKHTGGLKGIINFYKYLTENEFKLTKSHLLDYDLVEDVDLAAEDVAPPVEVVEPATGMTKVQQLIIDEMRLKLDSRTLKHERKMHEKRVAAKLAKDDSSDLERERLHKWQEEMDKKWEILREMLNNLTSAENEELADEIRKEKEINERVKQAVGYTGEYYSTWIL